MLSMTERSIARLVLVPNERCSREQASPGARRPAVRRYRLVRLAPLTDPVSARFVHLSEMHD
jgi:hypothetical protein